MPSSRTAPGRDLISRQSPRFAAHGGRRKVGFYGCNNKVVRLEMRVPPASGKRYPQVVELECPACTHTHEAKPFWRVYDPAIDDGKEPVIVT